MRAANGCGSSRVVARPQLDDVLGRLVDGDTLVVWMLDRLGRSVGGLVRIVAALGERGVHLRSVTDQIDTASPAGRLVFHVFAALAEFEADLIRERTVAGLAAAKDRGRPGGRPTAMTPQRIAAARQLLADGKSVAEVARTLGVSRGAVYANLGRPSG
ncbi:MAG: recombinase family protein [Bifidobacteriaceae bacterium]|nr:recombinase family protein [Bifidobacteriaceae bacterium]